MACSLCLVVVLSTIFIPMHMKSEVTVSRNGQHIRCSFRQSSADDLRSVVVSTSREHCRLISNNNKCEPSNHQCEMKLRECGLLLDWQVQGTDLEPTEEGTFSAMFVGKVCCNNQCEYFGSSPTTNTEDLSNASSLPPKSPPNTATTTEHPSPSSSVLPNNSGPHQDDKYGAVAVVPVVLGITVVVVILYCLLRKKKKAWRCILFTNSRRDERDREPGRMNIGGDTTIIDSKGSDGQTYSEQKQSQEPPQSHHLAVNVDSNNTQSGPPPLPSGMRQRRVKRYGEDQKRNHQGEDSLPLLMSESALVEQESDLSDDELEEYERDGQEQMLVTPKEKSSEGEVKSRHNVQQQQIKHDEPKCMYSVYSSDLILFGGLAEEPIQPLLDTRNCPHGHNHSLYTSRVDFDYLPGNTQVLTDGEDTSECVQESDTWSCGEDNVFVVGSRMYTRPRTVMASQPLSVLRKASFIPLTNSQSFHTEETSSVKTLPTLSSVTIKELQTVISEDDIQNNNKVETFPKSATKYQLYIADTTYSRGQPFTKVSQFSPSKFIDKDQNSQLDELVDLPVPSEASQSCRSALKDELNERLVSPTPVVSHCEDDNFIELQPLTFSKLTIKSTTNQTCKNQSLDKLIYPSLKQSFIVSQPVQPNEVTCMNIQNVFEKSISSQHTGTSLWYMFSRHRIQINPKVLICKDRTKAFMNLNLTIMGSKRSSTAFLFSIFNLKLLDRKKSFSFGFLLLAAVLSLSHFSDHVLSSSMKIALEHISESTLL